MRNSNLNNEWKIQNGTVVSIDDPTFTGRIKVRIPGFNDNIDIKALPWIVPAPSNIAAGDGGGSISVLNVGDEVRVRYKNGESSDDMEWFGNNKLSHSLVNEIRKDYAGTHVLLWDNKNKVSIMYQPNETGLRFYLNETYIQITPLGNIIIHQGTSNSRTEINMSDDLVAITSNQNIQLEADNINIKANSTVNIDSPNITFMGGQNQGSAVNSKALFSVMEMLAKQIDSKNPQTIGWCQNYVKGSEPMMTQTNIKYS